MATKKKKKYVRANKQKSKYNSAKTSTFTAEYLPLVFLVIFLIFITVLRTAFVDFGLDRDEGAYTYLGEVLRNGGQMYADGYEMKPPGIFYLYAFINTIFGYSIQGLHWSVIVFNFLSGLGIYVLLKKWMSSWASAIGGICFSVFAFNPIISGFAGVAEHYMNFLLIAGALLLQFGIDKKKQWPILLAGFVFTFNVGIKQNGIFFWLIPILLFLIMLIIKRDKAKTFFKPIGLYLAGSLISAIIIFIPVFLQGTFDDFLYWVIKYPRENYTSSITIEKGFTYFTSYLKKNTAFHTILWILGALGVFISFIQFKKRIWLPMMLLILFVATFASIMPGFRFYGHYWLYFAPVLAIGNACLFETMSYQLKKRIKKAYISIPVAVYLIVLITGFSERSNISFNPVEIQILRLVYGDNPFTELRMLTESLEGKINKNDKVMVFGGEPQVYNYLDKQSVSRHIFMTYLVNQHERREEMQQEFKDVVSSENPDYIYLIVHPYSWVIMTQEEQELFEWCFRYTRHRYKPIAVGDIIPGQSPFLSVDESVVSTYRPKSEKYIYVYERIRQ